MKIGDSVKIVKTNDILNGEKGVVKKVCDTYCKVMFNKTCLGLMNVNKEYLKPLTPKPFTKADLRDGDIVITRDDCEYQVVWNTFLMDKNREFNLLEYYTNDLIIIKDNRDDFMEDFDIMTVTRNGEVVFKRKENEYYMHVFHKEKDGLCGNYVDKSKLLNDIEKLINDEDLMKLEVVKCNTN